MPIIIKLTFDLLKSTKGCTVDFYLYKEFQNFSSAFAHQEVRLQLYLECF